MTEIVDIEVLDLRFPTSQQLDGSDAMNPDPDYSAAYVILKTDRPGLEGHGLTFTIGRGNEICCAAIKAMRHLVVGLSLEEVQADLGAFWRHVTSDSQLRWIGPDKGAIHLATGAVVNAVWDLLAKMAVDDMDARRPQGPCRVEHMREHRPAGERHQHLRLGRLHPLAFAGGEDDHMQRRAAHGIPPSRRSAGAAAKPRHRRVSSQTETRRTF